MPLPTLNSLRQEPYRLFFPLGIALAFIGLGEWIPYYFFPETFSYPGRSHATIQIHGFLLCFIFGFLCTMLPKVLGVRALAFWQFAVFPIGFIGISISALGDAPLIGQVFHLVLILNFAYFVLSRWKHRTGSPPTSFSFIALGMGSNLLGTVLTLLGLSEIVGAPFLVLGKLLQYQGFPLFMILGVGSFLLPKLFGNQNVTPETLRLLKQPSSLNYLPWGLLFLSTYFIDAWFINTIVFRITSAIRAGVWIWFLCCPIGIHRIPKGLPAYLAGAKFSLCSIGLGLIMPVFLPTYRIAWEHLVFITGYLWLTVSIASRVLTAHGGRLDLLTQHRKKSLAIGWLFLCAVSARVSTDIWTGGHWMHMALASGFALIALGIWSYLNLNLVNRFPGKV